MKNAVTLLALALSSVLAAQDFERQYPNIEPVAVSSINIHESGVGYAAEECGALLKTTDGGLTWTQLFPDVSDASYTGHVVFTDDLDPGKVVYYNQYSIIKSADGFATSQNIKPNPISGLINDFIIMGNGDFGLMAGTFFHSADEGQTWTETETAELNGLDLFELDGYLFTAFRAVMRSADFGVTFDTVFNSSDVKRKFVNLNGKPVLSSSDNLYTSLDSGLTWEQIPATDYYGYADNLTVHEGRLITNSSNRINYSDDDGITWKSVVMPVGIYRTNSLFVNDDGRIFIGGEASQIYFTDDPESPLQVLFGEKEELNSIFSQGPKVVVAGSNGVLLRSEDGGDTWTKSIITDHNLDLPGFIGDRLFVVDNNEALLLVNADNSYTPVFVNSANYHTFEIAGDATTAYIGAGEKVYRTDDAGDSWAEIYVHPGSISRIQLVENDHLALLDYNGKLYMSDNNGDSWQLKSGSPDSTRSYLDFAIFDDMNFIVMSSSLLYKTTDGGASWTSTGRPYNGYRLYSMENESVLCLGTNAADGWLYKSDDQGSTFPQITKTCSTISRNGYYDRTTQTFWTAGSGLGIQKVQLVVSATKPSATSITSIQVFPNPAADMLHLQDNLSPAASVSIYNIMGTCVKRLTGGIQSVDISALVPGQYQLLVEQGNELMLSRFIKL